MCVGVSVWLGWSGIRVAGWSTASNTHRTENNTTNVVIQQNSRKLLMMDILMFKTCWTRKKWNKIASDIKLVFYSSTITMMHGPINIRSVITVRTGRRKIYNDRAYGLRVPGLAIGFLARARRFYSLQSIETRNNLIFLMPQNFSCDGFQLAVCSNYPPSST